MWRAALAAIIAIFVVKKVHDLVMNSKGEINVQEFLDKIDKSK